MTTRGQDEVDGIPLLWAAPDAPRALVLHVPAFGQRKDQAGELVDHLVGRGMATVVLDPYQHGARGDEDRAQLTRRVFGNFRREMWTILGETTLDLPRVASWARGRFDPALPLHLTGLSMGGDIAVAAAPFITDVASVHAVIATPDWTRPGMRDIASGQLVDQGTPDAKARFLFDGLNPIAHCDRYADLHVRFIVGGSDTHVPPEAAYRFQAAVHALAGGGRVTVIEKPGLGHLDLVKPVWFEDLDFGR